jgi:hypothetical protein
VGKRDSAFPLGINSLFVLPLLIWLQQINQWRDARPILKRLGQMRRLDGRLLSTAEWCWTVVISKHQFF